MILRAIDLCCGAGGWIEAAKGLPIQFVAAVDWAEDCCFTVRYNHPHVPVVCADVTRLPWRDLQGVDVLLGAVPCEELSQARASVPSPPAAIIAMQNLLDSMLSLVETLKPRYWGIENVPQMKKHLPPLTPHIVLNSQFWSGQSRQRVIVGDFPVPAKSAQRLTLNDFLLPGPGTITRREALTESISNRQWYTNKEIRVLKPHCPCPTVTNIGGGHRNRAFIVERTGKRRHLTLQEVGRLQGFPPDYVFVASPTRAAKMVAQAVQIDLARAILTAIVAEAGGEKVQHTPLLVLAGGAQ